MVAVFTGPVIYTFFIFIFFNLTAIVFVVVSYTVF